ncbi:MAG: hypothetical protein HC767_02390 [Akkermansiaceae bacterium]|nr:hypothetical protein [Akkermansiaceae bacterium]
MMLVGVYMGSPRALRSNKRLLREYCKMDLLPLKLVCSEDCSVVQGPEQAMAIKERLDAVGASESHAADVKCVGSQVFAVLPTSGSEGMFLSHR